VAVAPQAVIAALAVISAAQAAAVHPSPGADLARAARAQVGVTVHYDPAYRKMAYPNGDVARDRGVCSDVVVRALREARHFDLQRAVHEDMRTHWKAYPREWRWLSFSPDSNIDHRRVPNLMTYFARQGWSVPTSRSGADYLAGDIVAWRLQGEVLHIGVVSDRRRDDWVPLVIHNIGQGTKEEDVLFQFQIIGHYRIADAATAGSLH
jgi:uncharacterized protein YijF (DUF1287 family)